MEESVIIPCVTHFAERISYFSPFLCVIFVFPRPSCGVTITWIKSFSQADISAFLSFLLQIQNADDVLITPLEKFRKDQIGAAKVRDPLQSLQITSIFFLDAFLSKSPTLTKNLFGVYTMSL